MNKAGYLLLAILIGQALIGCRSASGSLKVEGWTVTYNQQTNGVDIRKGKSTLWEGVYPSFKMDDELITPDDYATHSVSSQRHEDLFGKGKLYRVTHTGRGLPTLVQSFYVYPKRDFILTEFTIESEREISSNYMAPVNLDSLDGQIRRDEHCRILAIPFDNDKWGRYKSLPMPCKDVRSYEVTAIFNNETRRGTVIGSVEHDSWKTAVTVDRCSAEGIKGVRCYGGVADEQTRDSKAHGRLKGRVIKSPKIFIGDFADWRNGMETYAEANATIAPPRAWEGSVPFGWNSWGVLQFGLTHQKAVEVSDFFAEHLQRNSFISPDSTVYIGLDSGWNSFTEEQLSDFVKRCRRNGQKAGVYWTPFTDWGRDPERNFEDCPQYKYKDVYLYANGKPQELDGAYALDPTHPAVEEAMRKKSALFRKIGFEYVKMDFMTHGAMEADSWYKDDIRTGMQGYNYGMKLLDEYFKDMYINLSISPLFPAQYAQSRRIACDAWNKIKDTEYTMNALSYGWWLDKVYQYNDADHIVLKDAEESENRARVTSGIITGLYILGDDFSAGGDDEAKRRVAKYTTKPDINAIADGQSFRPVEGDGEMSEHLFVKSGRDGNVLLAVFNYSEKELAETVSLERIGLKAEKTYKVKELWSGKETTTQANLSYTVPPKDVLLFQINEGH